MAPSKKSKVSEGRRHGETDPRRRGRPPVRPTLDPGICKVICERLRAGECIEIICADPGMPDMMAFYKAVAKDAALRRSVAGARDAACNDLRTDLIGIACAMIGDGERDPRLRVLTSRLRAEKLVRKGASEKIQQDVNVSNNGPSPEFLELAARLKEMERAKRMTIEHQPKKDEEE